MFSHNAGRLTINIVELVTNAVLSHSLPPFEQHLEKLLGDVFTSIERKDRNARLSKPFHQRHRLPVLLEIVRKWEQGIKDLPIPPLNALAELIVTLQLFERCLTDPLWPKLVTGLKNPTDYAHTVVLLGLTSHMREAGKDITLQPPANTGRSCDLRVLVTSMPHTGFNLEVKVPSELLWPIQPLPPAKALKQTKHLFRSAGTNEKGQLPPPVTGILVVGGLSFDQRTRDMLQSAGERHLLNPPGDYSHIAGVLYFWLGHQLTVSPSVIDGDRLRLRSYLDTLAQIAFVRNPHYSGPLNLELVDSAVEWK